MPRGEKAMNSMQGSRPTCAGMETYLESVGYARSFSHDKGVNRTGAFQAVAEV